MSVRLLVLLVSALLMGCASVAPKEVISLSPNERAYEKQWLEVTEQAERCTWTYFHLFQEGDASYRTLFQELSPSTGRRKLTYVLVDHRRTNYLIASKDCTLITAYYIMSRPKQADEAARHNQERSASSSQEGTDSQQRTPEEKAAPNTPAPTTPPSEAATTDDVPVETRVELLQFRTRQESIASVSTLVSWTGSVVSIKQEERTKPVRGRLVRVVKAGKLEAHLVTSEGEKKIVKLTEVEWVERRVEFQDQAK